MTILKLKSLIYRKLGLYLAHKEELKYIKSREFWKQFYKMYSHKDNDMRPKDIQGLLIGTWQCEHKFYRPFKSGYKGLSK